MEELLVPFFQFAIELIVNVLSWVPLDWPSKDRTTQETEIVWPQCIAWCIAGGLLGGISLLVLHYSLINGGWLRIANLALSPLASGLMAKTMAERRYRTNPMLIPRNHFWYGFWFSFGVAGVRFAYAMRA